MKITIKFSPNYSSRKEKKGAQVQLVVLHSTDGSFPGDLNWLTSKESKVSAHYLISPGGDVFSLVPEAYQAWHAGANTKWDGYSNSQVNSISVGIELSNRTSQREPYLEPQYQALAELCAAILKRHQLGSDRIVSHAEITTIPGRRIDPGPKFDWDYFRGLLASRMGVGTIHELPLPAPAWAQVSLQWAKENGIMQDTTWDAPVNRAILAATLKNLYDAVSRGK